MMLYLGGLTRLLSLIKTKQTCNELILIFTTFVPFFSIWILQGMLGREASLWAEGCYSVLGFFFTISFCQASLIRGLSLAGHCKGLFMPPSLAYSPSLFLSALYFQHTTMLLSRRRIFSAIGTHTSCRTTWTRLQSEKRVSLRGPGWGSVQGCRTHTMAILREGHASSFE